MSGDDVLLLWVVGALGAGMAIGMIIAYWFLPSDSGNRKLIRQNRQLESEQERYRQEVQEHFAKTGELFEDLTRSYRDVYEHLASGAVNLGGETKEPPELDLPDARRLIEAAQGTAQEPSEVEQIATEQAEPAVEASEVGADADKERAAAESEEEASPATEAVPPAARLDDALTTGAEGEGPVTEAEEREPRQTLETEEGEPTQADRSYRQPPVTDIAPPPEMPLSSARSVAGDEEPEDRPRALH